MNKNRNAYLFVILVILLVLVLVFVFRKSEPKPIQPSPIDTPPTQVEKDVSIIDAASSPDDYYSKIMLYASVLYDNGFCESHSYDVEERKMCKITLNDLSRELTEYNFENLYNFDGKKVIPFCTSGGSGIGRSGSNLGTLAGGGNFVTGERLNSSADTNNIQNFINSNK